MLSRKSSNRLRALFTRYTIVASVTILVYLTFYRPLLLRKGWLPIAPESSAVAEQNSYYISLPGYNRKMAAHNEHSRVHKSSPESIPQEKVDKEQGPAVLGDKKTKSEPIKSPTVPDSIEPMRKQDNEGPGDQQVTVSTTEEKQRDSEGKPSTTDDNNRTAESPSSTTSEEIRRLVVNRDPTLDPDYEERGPKVYKQEPPSNQPIQDPFPWLTENTRFPPVPIHNQPPSPHVPEQTPLLIGFTRNWPLLLQAVSSYVAAGWPPSDIYVVENTGTFGSNRAGRLSLQNPFFLNVTQLEKGLGVNVITTPTLLSFAQLQNYYLSTASEKGWRYFFWSHQDVMAFTDERDTTPRKALYEGDQVDGRTETMYTRAVAKLRQLREPTATKWATHLFAYDHLALVDRDAFLDIGAWDTMIPFYATDCDMYIRLRWAKYETGSSVIGRVFDVSTTMKDLGALFRLPGARSFQEETTGGEQSENQQGETYDSLMETGQAMEESKTSGEGVHRNTWQGVQQGGKGEPFYRDSRGFDSSITMHIDLGRTVFAEKWGHRGCDLLEIGVVETDAWRLERDWDIATQGPGSRAGSWHKAWMTTDQPLTKHR